MSLGLALAGGGLKGVAYIGALKALEELNVKIDYLSATSSGSLIATMYALGYNFEEMKSRIAEYSKVLTKINAGPILKAGASFAATGVAKIEGLIPGENIEEIVNQMGREKGVENISDLKIPFAVPTADMISTKECIFLSRKYDFKNDDIEYIYDVTLGKAIRSSMSFPGIFTPCSFEKYNFVDGGTKDNLPVQILKDMGAEKVLALSFKMDEYEPKENLMSILLRVCDIFSLKNVKEAQMKSDFYIEFDTAGSSLLSTDNMDKCYRIGYDTIMKNKENILKMLEE